jgi:hypothetical protein
MHLLKRLRDSTAVVHRKQQACESTGVHSMCASEQRGHAKRQTVGKPRDGKLRGLGGLLIATLAEPPNDPVVRRNDAAPSNR